MTPHGTDSISARCQNVDVASFTYTLKQNMTLAVCFSWGTKDAKLKGDTKWRNSKGSINTNKKLKSQQSFSWLMVYLKKQNIFNATQSHENTAVHTAILCVFFILFIWTLVERLASRRAISASQWQLHSTILCFWADPLHSSRMRLWMSDCGFTQCVLNIKRSGCSAVLIVAQMVPSETSLCLWCHEQGQHVYHECLSCHLPTFSCSSLIKCKPITLCPGELKFRERKRKNKYFCCIIFAGTAIQACKWEYLHISSFLCWLCRFTWGPL